MVTSQRAGRAKRSVIKDSKPIDYKKRSLKFSPIAQLVERYTDNVEVAVRSARDYRELAHPDSCRRPDIPTFGREGQGYIHFGAFINTGNWLSWPEHLPCTQGGQGFGSLFSTKTIYDLHKDSIVVFVNLIRMYLEVRASTSRSGGSEPDVTLEA